MLELIADNYRVQVFDDESYNPISTDNPHSYANVYDLDNCRHDYVTSRHGACVTENDVLVTTCILLAGRGPTQTHGHSAIIHENSCYIAVGPFVAALKLPTLSLDWATQTDDATCFGVYRSAKHNCLISHGELQIARVTPDGKITWNASGGDIFTNGFSMLDDSIRVVDFNDYEYIFDIVTGSLIAE